MSAKTLSFVMNMSESEAAAFIDSFKATFPGLKKFISNQIENCKLKGYVETIRKRRRCFPNITSTDIKLRTQAERQAINTIVQGSASDLVNLFLQ
jgi:DNA polymerase I-like protein with 3'-5' exonuclease and polymerase domains